MHVDGIEAGVLVCETGGTEVGSHRHAHASTCARMQEGMHTREEKREGGLKISPLAESFFGDRGGGRFSSTQRGRHMSPGWGRGDGGHASA